ncbi:hypothetical protein V9K67_22785, partial [Paraflavisolibacter sp. H34]
MKVLIGSSALFFFNPEKRAFTGYVYKKTPMRPVSTPALPCSPKPTFTARFSGVALIYQTKPL